MADPDDQPVPRPVDGYGPAQTEVVPHETANRGPSCPGCGTANTPGADPNVDLHLVPVERITSGGAHHGRWLCHRCDTVFTGGEPEWVANREAREQHGGPQPTAVPATARAAPEAAENDADGP